MPDADGNPVWVGHMISIPDERYYVVLSSGDDWRLSAEWQGDASLMLRPGGTDDALTPAFTARCLSRLTAISP